MCHVLIIEDEPFVALDLERMLEENGATSFDLAMTETEAVDCAQARRPEFIVSDVQLLEGTGPLAVARITSACGPVPVIFVTGTPQACKPCSEAAVILTKPVDERQFAEAFHALGSTGTR